MADSDLQVIQFDAPPSPEEIFTEDRCYFYHAGAYWLTYAYLRKDQQWLGKGCTAVGDHGSWEYWAGTRFRGAVCAFGKEALFCDVTLGPGQTITLRGTACHPTYDITSRDDALAAIKANFSLSPSA